MGKLLFYVENSSVQVVSYLRFFYCFWLLNCESLHQPDELILRKESCFFCCSRPLKSAVFTVKRFGQKKKSVAFPAETFDLPGISSAEQKQAFGIWIKIVSSLDYLYQSCLTFSHICVSTDHIDVRDGGFSQHSASPLITDSIVVSVIGSSTVTSFFLITIISDGEAVS